MGGSKKILQGLCATKDGVKNQLECQCKCIGSVFGPNFQDLHSLPQSTQNYLLFCVPVKMPIWLYLLLFQPLLLIYIHLSIYSFSFWGFVQRVLCTLEFTIMLHLQPISHKVISSSLQLVIWSCTRLLLVLAQINKLYNFLFFHFLIVHLLPILFQMSQIWFFFFLAKSDQECVFIVTLLYVMLLMYFN